MERVGRGNRSLENELDFGTLHGTGQAAVGVDAGVPARAAPEERLRRGEVVGQRSLTSPVRIRVLVLQEVVRRLVPARVTVGIRAVSRHGVISRRRRQTQRDFSSCVCRCARFIHARGAVARVEKLGREAVASNSACFRGDLQLDVLDVLRSSVRGRERTRRHRGSGALTFAMSDGELNVGNRRAEGNGVRIARVRHTPEPRQDGTARRCVVVRAHEGRQLEVEVLLRGRGPQAGCHCAVIGDIVRGRWRSRARVSGPGVECSCRLPRTDTGTYVVRWCSRGGGGTLPPAHAHQAGDVLDDGRWRGLIAQAVDRHVVCRAVSGHEARVVEVARRARRRVGCGRARPSNSESGPVPTRRARRRSLVPRRPSRCGPTRQG